MSGGDDYESYFVGSKFTTNWTSRNYKLWAGLLESRRDDSLRLLEIGSWEGRSALFFLNYFPRATLVCIDTFAGSIEHRSWPFAQRWRQLRGIEARFDHNVARFGIRAEKIKADSAVALGQLGLARRRFDFIYVDGSHLALDVYRDGMLAWPLLVPGGIIIFDDYQRKRGPAQDLPGVGIDAFLEMVGSGYEELFRGHQIAIRKIRWASEMVSS